MRGASLLALGLLLLTLLTTATAVARAGAVNAAPGAQQDVLPQFTQTPPPSASEGPPATAQASATVTASSTVTATVEATSTATATVVPALTATPTATGTAQPTPDEPTVYRQHLPIVQRSLPHVPPGCVPDSRYPAQDLEQEQQVLEGLNAYRLSNGLPPLAPLPQLTQAARRHAQDMVSKGFVAHVGSDGSTAGERISDACYAWTAVGQIIGINDSAGEMIAAWLASENNRQLILSTRYGNFGAGYAYVPGGSPQQAWVVTFGRPEAAGVVEELLPGAS